MSFKGIITTSARRGRLIFATVRSRGLFVVRVAFSLEREELAATREEAADREKKEEEEEEEGFRLAYLVTTICRQIHRAP